MLLFKNLHFLTIALLLTLTACGGGGGGGDDDDDAVPTPVFKTFQPADVVIGQPDFGSASANQGGATGANTLKFVHGAPAQGSLYLPDINNHRILGFNSIPATSNASADFVLGQTAFTGNAAGTTANSFTGPFDVVTADGKLFVVDTFNHRVLIWNTLPTSNNVPADVVVGANSFTDSTPGTSKTELNVPTGIAVAGGKMFVVEQTNHRVLIWNSIPTGNNAPADVVIGQPDFTSSTPGLSATKIENPLGGIWSDGQRLAVTDSFNNRVLVWNTIPTTNGVAADLVIGQPDFVTGTASTTSQGLNAPVGVFSNGRELFIADSQNHRILIFDSFPTTSQSSADRVLGQSDFLKGVHNDDDQDGFSDATPSARTLHAPRGIKLIANRLFVGDGENNRVLIFQPE